MPRRRGVTAFAHGEVFAAESALAVVTSHATLRAARGVMIKLFRSCHLSSLRQAGTHLMAFVASNLLMLCVTEADTKRLHEFRRSGVTTQLMARAARRNIPTTGLRARRVTTIAGRVCIEAGGNRHRHAAARFAMTSRATDAAHTHVARVIELHPKALQARKRFRGAGLHICMTDSADRTFGI